LKFLELVFYRREKVNTNNEHERKRRETERDFNEKSTNISLALIPCQILYIPVALNQNLRHR
jgi:hypothetical protein